MPGRAIPGTGAGGRSDAGGRTSCGTPQPVRTPVRTPDTSSPAPPADREPPERLGDPGLGALTAALAPAAQPDGWKGGASAFGPGPASQDKLPPRWLPRGLGPLHTPTAFGLRRWGRPCHPSLSSRFPHGHTGPTARAGTCWGGHLVCASPTRSADGAQPPPPAFACQGAPAPEMLLQPPWPPERPTCDRVVASGCARRGLEAVPQRGPRTRP